MIPEEEVLNNIKEMGYVALKPRAIYPSYYKLHDGTIVQAFIHVNYLLADPNTPQGFRVNSTNLVTAFVPREKRKPASFQPFTQEELQNGVVEEDVEYEVMRENFSVYELSNGLVMSIKTVMGQIRKTKYFTIDGEPIYLVNVNPILKVKKD